MDGAEILTMANLHTDDGAIGSDDGLRFINEWLLMDLGKDAGITDSTEITSLAADTWCNLPTDFIEETEILRDGSPYWGKFYGQDYRGDYDVRNGQIRFPYAGVFTIHYFRRPTGIADLSETPEVNAVFHYSGGLYVAYRYKYYNSDENKDAALLLAEYQNYKQKAIIEFRKMNRTSTRASSRVRVGPWR